MVKKDYVNTVLECIGKQFEVMNEKLLNLLLLTNLSEKREREREKMENYNQFFKMPHLHTNKSHCQPQKLISMYMIYKCECERSSSIIVFHSGFTFLCIIIFIVSLRIH